MPIHITLPTAAAVTVVADSARRNAEIVAADTVSTKKLLGRQMLRVDFGNCEVIKRAGNDGLNKNARKNFSVWKESSY